ncbi:MAG: hypothetical protein CVU05_13300, partial [Bacteroidetes bacterium HGW-Bacteroidetes-21]
MMSSVFSQTRDTSVYNVPVDPENFQPELFNGYILYKINELRKKLKLDTLVIDNILQNAAEDQSEYMSFQNTVTPDQSGKKKNVGMRVKYYGGSVRAEELISKANITKGKEVVTYIQAANEILAKWFADEKTLRVINNPAYMLVGLGSTPDDAKKKTYFSIVFGNFQIYNNGAAKRGQMAVPYTKKKYGLKGYDAKTCKKCDKFRNIEALQQGIYVEGGFVYFKTDNYQTLKKVLKNPGDGIVIDFIQPAQYVCGEENIVDFNRVNKGVMMKKFSSAKMAKKNMIKDPKEAKKKLDVKIGPIPKGITEPYEINLLIYLDKRVCRNISKTFTNEGAIVYDDAIELLADTVIISGGDYIPTAENSTLTFRIPFERNKAQYKREDIEPFLKKLKEPDFVI